MTEDLQELAELCGDAGGFAVDVDRVWQEVNVPVHVDDGDVDVDRVRVELAISSHQRQRTQLLRVATQIAVQPSRK
jgi:hypothetical protein